MLVLTRITHYSSQGLIKPELSRRSLEKSTNIKFHENPSMESRIAPCHAEGQIYRLTDERTERYDKANSCFSQFYKNL